MDTKPWEGLDIDNPNLPLFVKGSISNAPSIISILVGVIPKIMNNCVVEESLSTQEFINRVKHEYEWDFLVKPWIRVVQFFKSTGIVLINFEVNYFGIIH